MKMDLGFERLKGFAKNNLSGLCPELHVVLGSGLAGIFENYVDTTRWKELGTLNFSDIPGIVPSSVAGHKGAFKFYSHLKTQKTICFQMGRLHGYEGHDPSLVVRPLTLMRELGTQTFILTNAAGGLNKKQKVGSVMMIVDQVNLTGKNPLWGPNPTWSNGQARGPRFPDMSEAYDSKITKSLSLYLSKNKIKNYKGTYLGVLGPSFESPAEVKLFSSWGMGAVGMSTVWETIALVHSGAKVAGLSFISNMGCGLLKKEKLTHEDVQHQANKSAPKIIKSLFDFAGDFVDPKKKR